MGVLFPKQYTMTRQTFGSSGDNEQPSLLSISYGYTKLRGVGAGATTASLRHNVPAGAIMKVADFNMTTKATALTTATSYTSPALTANSVVTLGLTTQAGHKYTVHYYIANWHADPVNQNPTYGDASTL